MKLRKLLLGDIKFQYKYGFYFVYGIFTILYIFLLKILPNSLASTLSVILIFTDPSIIGLIFMGAIIQFEISERTIHSLYISPIKPSEYVLSKLLSLTFISTFVGLIIGISSDFTNNYFWFLSGLILGSMLFSSLGLILSLKTISLNQFFLVAIPIMIVVILPGCAYLFGLKNKILLIHPGVSIIELLTNGQFVFVSFINLLIWFIVIYRLTNRIVIQKFRQGSGK